MSADSSTPEAGPLAPGSPGGDRLSLVDAEIEQEKRWHTHRRRLGLVLGIALGLAFGLVSQYGNALLAPGIPLYHPLFGAAGNLLLCVAIGVVLGLVTAWPKNAFVGAIAGCAAGALLFEVAIILTGENTPNVVAGKAASTLLTFLPLAATLALPIGTFRWVVSKEEGARRNGAPTWRRIPLPVLLVLVAAAFGTLMLYPERGRIVLPRMNAIVQAALNAADRAGLPAPFQTIDAPGYPQQAKGSYTLDWQGEQMGRFGIPRPIENEREQSAVIARFDNGWSFVCLFITPDAEPRCAPLYVEP
jgi:hypothetical protein